MAIVFITLSATGATRLTLSQANGKPGSLRPLDNTSYELRSNGGISLYATPEGPLPAEPLILEFDYFSLGGVPKFAIISGPPYDGREARWTGPLGHSEAWTPHRIQLNQDGKTLPKSWKRFRIDLPISEETTLRIRNARLRTEKPNETTQSTSTASETTTNLKNYLDAQFKAQITQVSVTPDRILITGNTSGLVDGLAIAEIPTEKLLSDPQRFVEKTSITAAPDGSFSLDLPRHSERDGRMSDRLTSKWQIVTVAPSGTQPVSHARYPDEVACRAPELPPAKPKSKKGLGDWQAQHGPKGELEALDIASITVNVTLEQIISLTPGKNTIPVHWQGQSYYANLHALENYDETFREAACHNIMVSAILLIGNPARSNHPTVKILGHPDAVPEGTYAMPNVTSTDGLQLYGAVLNLMAERWSRPDGEHGRVHHWIVHNEVDAGWTWTNCGTKELLPFVDLYYRSLRMVHLITRQYDPHTRPFVSLTHHWAKTVNPRYYPSRDILETLVRFTSAEGDFPWALAYHPYPQSLRNPRTWEDHQATETFDTAKITPHNIEVLDRWMKTHHMLHQNTEVRPIHLSENGFNSPDYSKESLHDQAAGMAYAWKKISQLDSVEAWQYHNWIDNRKEGGLRIGLRKFPDAPGDPHGKKPIWHLYQSLGTESENEACKPYLDYINPEPAR